MWTGDQLQRSKYELWKFDPTNTRLWDVELVATDDGDTAVHACVSDLAAFSPVLRDLCASEDFGGGRVQRIPVGQIKGSVLRQLVIYLYSGEGLPLDSENVAGYLDAGDRFQVDSIKDECCQFLALQLSPASAICTLVLAQRYCCADLEHQAQQYAADNLKAVALAVPDSDLAGLSAQQVLAVLDRTSAEVRRSTALLDWVAALQARGLAAAVDVQQVGALVAVDDATPEQLICIGQHPLAAQAGVAALALRVLGDHALKYDRAVIGYRSSCIYTEAKGCKHVVCWRIKHWAQQQGKTLESPRFMVPGTGVDWYLQCYPSGRRDYARDFVSLYLCPATTLLRTVRLRYQLFVLNQQHSSKTRTKLSHGHIFEQGLISSTGWARVVSRKVLKVQPGFVINGEVVVGINALAL